MFELTAENASVYLGYPCRATELGGGVSNTVLLIEAEDGRLVLKQSLGKLRVEQDWFSDRKRIFRESSALRRLKELLPTGALPEVLFEDQSNFLFAMSAAEPASEPWKDRLLRGDVDAGIGERLGQLLGRMISSTWNNPSFDAEFGDQTIFNELRVDPYYRSTAARHPDLASHFARLIEESAARRVSLVHGDWSPKNFLLGPYSPMVIDFEVVHYGDPSFDAAFLLNHLLLKSFHLPGCRPALKKAAQLFFQSAADSLPQPSAWFEPATIAHLGALLLARIDGKSPAEYLRGESAKAAIRHFARALILYPPESVDAVFELLRA